MERIALVALRENKKSGADIALVKKYIDHYLRIGLTDSEVLEILKPLQEDRIITSKMNKYYLL